MALKLLQCENNFILYRNQAISKSFLTPKIQPVIKRINGLICMVVHGKTVLVNASR